MKGSAIERLGSMDPSRSSTIPPQGKRLNRLRTAIDRSATLTFTIGGLATILSILAIFLYLFLEVVPLFVPPSFVPGVRVPTELTDVDVRSPNVVVGIDEYMDVAYVIEAGKASFLRLPAGEPLEPDGVKTFAPGDITAVSTSSGKTHRLGLGTKNGQVIPMQVKFKIDYRGDERRIHPHVVYDSPLQVSPTPQAIARLAYQPTESGAVAAVLTDRGQFWVARAQERSGGFFALEKEFDIVRGEISDPEVVSITTLLLDGLGETLIAGTKDGTLLHYDLRAVGKPRLTGSFKLDPPAAVTALAYLLGDRSLVVGTDQGTVSVWMPWSDPDTGGDPILRHIRNFTSHPAIVLRISPSQRDKGFLTADALGNIYIHYSTSGQTLLQIPADDAPLLGAELSPKADGVIALYEPGTLKTYALENEHPEATFSSLFRPVVYEGYREPQHIWQSSSGSDDFEPKFGMWPLIFGTLKGTVYAMLLATPLAVLGAIYTAMFMHPAIRAIVKPAVEIMAALPTVVLGFLAGLWFAPLLEKIFPAVATLFLVVPLSILAVSVLWQFLPKQFTGSTGSFKELMAFMGVIVGSIWLCLSLNQQIEAVLFGADYKGWLLSRFGVGYDQRNALVIAFAMGIAVIPTIFSISEDSISNVPRHLIAGSLALGATPWQTLTKLVIISASPGLFSALMIGLGRVVGETMIVLMATGNTPVMDMNLFNGFRTLSANIAVEMPEAPHGGTLYRLLFLAGLILFVFTSVVNTFAEIIRQRLRARYSQF